MLAYLRDHMERSAARLRPFYGWSATGVEIADGERAGDVTLQHVRAGETSTVRAPVRRGLRRGAQRVRAAIGRELVGDGTDEHWGVMDVLAVTDFPDIRRQGARSSRRDGNLLFIPREGGYLVRLYLELDEIEDRECSRTAGHAGQLATWPTAS